jgi:3-oxo-5-alpha-steroid 4-dehydrogenase 1
VPGLVATEPWVILALSGVVFISSFAVTAPYGRHFNTSWGPSLSARAAWAIMESPSFILFGWASWTNPSHLDPTVLALAGLWLLHYGQRTFVYPALMREGGRRMPLATVLMAIAFNVPNGLANGFALVPRAVDWQLVAGAALFLAGFLGNVHSDAVTRSLRKPGESGYSVPNAGLHRLVAAPNYLCEIVEWSGFALAAGTWPALAFAVFTFANLAPRARAHLKWYREKFPDYPRGRRALIPGVF